MSTRYQFLASVPRGFADLLATELAGFGALDVRERGNGVAFTGTLEVAYRACLESRVASRVFLEILRFEAETDSQIYEALRRVDWARHVDPRGTLSCEWSGRHPAVGNTHFGTLRLKDAICDTLRAVSGLRPDVATTEPSVRVHAHAVGTRITVSIDLAGEGLHRRGWRTDTGEAPLRENVAAGLLLRAGWPAQAARGGAFVDPMCGAGTLVIEAARIAADVATNLDRHYFGFLRWLGHDASAWQAVLEAARARAAQGLARRAERGPIVGRDRDPRAVRMARDNAQRAGVGDWCRFEVGDLESAAAPDGTPEIDPPRGLLCCNPPYGVRLGDLGEARAGHVTLGRVLRERFQGWNAAILTGAPELGLELGLRASRVHTVWNGAIECRLLRIEVAAAAERDLRPKRESSIDVGLAESPGAKMFANRLAKNQRTLAAWVKRESPGCYRLYDADMPEYSFAIDLYAGEGADERWLYVQEYLAPRDIPEDAVRRRRSEALATLPGATGVPVERIHLRTRKRNARGEQYSKVGEAETRRSLWANPYGFAEWFNSRTPAEATFGVFFEERSLQYDQSQVSIALNAEAEPVPDQLPAYRKSRALIALQLIKRWRNLVYGRKYPNLRLPPSVLLAHFVAVNANRTSSLAEELLYQIECLIAVLGHADMRGMKVHAVNEACPDDILTDRWPGALGDQRTFISELRLFAEKVRVLRRGVPLPQIYEVLEELFGERPARGAVAGFAGQHEADRIAGNTAHMRKIGGIPALGAAFAAPAAAHSTPKHTFYGD